MEKIKIKFIEKSQNSKTGNISQTYSTPNTCPLRCPFKNNGCYAENFYTKMVWKKTEKFGADPKELKEIIQKSKHHSSIIRHNIAGDIAIPCTNNIDAKLVNILCDAYKNCNAYTYTHCEISKENIQIVKDACKKGFVINFSTETVEDAKKCIENGVNCVMTCNTILNKVVEKNGIKFVQCPATLDKEKHCANCKLCLLKERKFVIVFPIHGNGKKKAINSGILTDL